MKNKLLNTVILKYVFYILLTCVLCVRCVKTKIIEREIVKTEYDTIYIYGYVDNIRIKHSTGFSQFRISKCPYCGGNAYVHEAINGDGFYTVNCLNEFNGQTECKRLLNKWYDSFEEAVYAWENACQQYYIKDKIERMEK